MELADLEKNLGIKFNNTEYIEEALTHSSSLNETHKTVCNERLEFLGDAILGAVIADMLYAEYKDVDEGILTQTRSVMIRRSTLAEFASKYGIGKCLYLGKGEEACGGRTNARNLAGAMEAVIAAIYLDQGWDITYRFLFNAFEEELNNQKRIEKETDYKSLLQETIQSKLKITPSYEIIDESGPVHDCVFTAIVKAGEEILGEGKGHSKKQAEIESAKNALEKF